LAQFDVQNTECFDPNEKKKIHIILNVGEVQIGEKILIIETQRFILSILSSQTDWIIIAKWKIE
jgi:hypothetical protein